MPALSNWTVLETVWDHVYGQSATITFGTAPASGELLVAGVSINDSGTDNEPAAPSGWTRIGVSGSGYRTIATFAKIAGSSEGTQHTFTITDSGSMLAAFGFRISGSADSASLHNGQVTTHAAINSSTVSVDKTTTNANSLLFAYCHSHNPNDGDAATGSKTWNTGWYSIQLLQGTNDRCQTALMEADGTSETATVTFDTGDSDRFSIAIAEINLAATAPVGVITDTIYEPDSDTIVADTTSATVRIWDAATISGAPNATLTNQSITNGVMTFERGSSTGSDISYQIIWSTSGGANRFVEVQGDKTETL